jgi:hypothetical protein
MIPPDFFWNFVLCRRDSEHSADEQALSYQLNICCLNVCGLVSKLLNPVFTSLFENYDILVFQESKTE